MLRECIPQFKPALGPRGDVGMLPRLREPVSVTFRPGSDMLEVVAMAKANKNLLVEASPGAGKSTILPGRVAKELGVLVLHVFPNERLAWDVSTYVRKTGGKVEFIESVEDAYPEAGVACISAACLVAKWLAAGEVVFPSCVVYHDEFHDSDGFTYLVKLLTPTSDMVKCYMRVSATQNAAGFRSYEEKGKLERGSYEGPVSSWDPYDEGKPWSINSLRGNAMLFVDSKTAAANLMESYASAGFASYRLTSRTELASYKTAAGAVADVNGPMVVLIADSSYRSGYTFDLSTIVDSGKVGYLEVVNGRPVRRERNAYQLELYQGAARGSRLVGLRTKYYAPRGLAGESKICDLEPVETEAVALILRVLGYKLPREFDHCRMAKSGVPRDLCSALRGAQPLALIREDSLVSLDLSAVPVRSKSPFLADDVSVRPDSPLDVKDVRVSADTARERGEQGYKKVGHGVVWDAAWQEDLNILLKPQRGVDELQLGKAYYASGLDTDEETSIVFPDGADSVIRYVYGDRSNVSFNGLVPRQRSIAINMLLARQAALAAEMDGIGRALRSVRESGHAVGTVAARNLAARVAERLGAASSDLSVTNEALTKLGEGFCTYHEMEINIAMSDRIYRSWLAAWEALPEHRMQGPKELSFNAQRHGARALADVVNGVKPRLSDRPFVPMPPVGGGMRAITGPIGLARSMSVSSGSDDGRCTGSTYWEMDLIKTTNGLARQRKLVCRICGSGVSKKTHNY